MKYFLFECNVFRILNQAHLIFFRIQAGGYQEAGLNRYSSKGYIDLRISTSLHRSPSRPDSVGI